MSESKPIKIEEKKVDLDKNKISDK